MISAPMATVKNYRHFVIKCEKCVLVSEFNVVGAVLNAVIMKFNMQ